MKKIICLLMALCMVFTTAGCSDNASKERSDKVDSESSLKENDESSAVDSLVAETEDELDFEESEVEESETLQETFNQAATIEETVMYDEGDVKITATGISYNNYSAELELLIENNTDKDLQFVSGSMGYSCNSVNGIMTNDGYLLCDVAAGKKANDYIRFDYDQLMLYGINEIADIEIGFDISDDDYNHIYSGPRQVKTSIYDSYDYKSNHYQQGIKSSAAMNTYGYKLIYFSEEALYDENGVKLISSGVMATDEGDMMLLLEFENTTENQIYIRTSDISINGLVVTEGYWDSDALNAGKHAAVEIEITSALKKEFWDMLGIDNVGKISLSVMQRDFEDNDLTENALLEIIVSGVDAGFNPEGTEVYAKDGLRIVNKGIVEDASEYSMDMYVLLLVENNSGKTLTIKDVYDSLSVNGFMTDYSFYRRELTDSESAVIPVKLWESSLEENKIAAITDITEVELGLEIVDGRDSFDEPVLTLAFE